MSSNCVEELPVPSISNNSPIGRTLGALRQWLRNEGSQPGQLLPSQRDLCQQLRVTRPTVRRAIEILEAEGLVQHRGARTRMVRAQPVTSESNLLSDTVVVLSLVAEGIHKIAGHKHEGWAEVIGDSAIAEARRNGFGALALLAKNCTEARLRGIALGNPVGFLVPELLGEETRILSILSSLPRRTVPIVVYGDARELDSFDRICSDAEEGAYLLTSSLIKRGARRILNFWTASPEKHDWAAKRLAGYRRAMQESGLDPLPVSVAATFPAHSLDVDVFDARTRYVAGYLFEHLRKSGGIDALMLTTDGEIPFTASACRICGMKPNEDVLLAGYDNYWLDLAPELLDREPCPPLATIDKRNAEIGRAMVTLLRDRRSGQLTEAPVSRSVAPVLVTDLVR